MYYKGRPYRESLKTADVHHVVGVLWYDVGALDGLAQRRDHMRGAVGVLGVRQNLLYQQVVLLDALDRLNQQISKLKFDKCILM